MGNKYFLTIKKIVAVRFTKYNFLYFEKKMETCKKDSQKRIRDIQRNSYLTPIVRYCNELE